MIIELSQLIRRKGIIVTEEGVQVQEDSLVWFLPTVAQVVPGELRAGAKTFITAITCKRSLM